MSSKKNFRKQFWEEKNVVGAMSPSSKHLMEKMLSKVDFDQSKVIVELGPGTGIFTEGIINRMRNDATLLVFEVNDSFYENLKKQLKDERVHLIHDSAENIAKYLKKYDLGEADVVVSSLPLAVFSLQLRKKVLLASKIALKKGGKFVQFQYSLQSRKIISKIFNNMSVSFTAMNFPPAFIYSCNKDN